MRLRPRGQPSEPRMHPITFCAGCSEAIPAQAMVCFRCGAKQPHGEKALQVVFCRRCHQDYPARAMACYHCGHLNPRHPYLRGHIAS
ncbi:MAG: double zinc ribbon domain-containing protein [Planctomycetota bacterium]|jgi:ribosomal protein L40E